MPIIPTGDKVLVKRYEAEKVSSGGIHIPATAQEHQDRATVVAVGPGLPNREGVLIPVGFTAGDTVILSAWVGHEVKDGEEKMLLVRESDVLAVVTG